MVKSSKNRGQKGLSDKSRLKKIEKTKKVNPFEIKVSKQKHNVLGKKIARHDKGMPGMSRFKAHEKRKQTLLIEYKKRNKTNNYLDRRIGENDSEMGIEEKLLKRFAVEKKRSNTKNDQFNLNESETLTHHGQSLAEIEKHEVPVESESDEEDGRLDAKLVGSEHFGGFLSKNNSTDVNKTWKQKMEEAIAKSKKQKYEKQKEKEENFELTTQLDSEWKELQMLITANKKNREQKELNAQNDDYDTIVRALNFESRGQATNRLKTPEEIAIEDNETLQKLEADRVRRMNGLSDADVSSKFTHKSADSLEDCYSIDKSFYKKSNQRKNSKYMHDNCDETLTSDCSSLEENNDPNDLEKDLFKVNDLEKDSNKVNKKSKKIKTTKRVSFKLDKSENVYENSSIQENEKPVEFLCNNTPERQVLIDSAKKELPYTFTAPDNYGELFELLDGHTSSDKMLVISRLRKTHHPSLNEKNKEILQKLFIYLTRYVMDIASEDIGCVEMMLKELYELCMFSPHQCAIELRSILESHANLFLSSEYRGFPGVETIVLLKLVSVLFSVTDRRHLVVTPAMLYMAQLLCVPLIRSIADIVIGLSVCSVFYQYVQSSKRFVPELVSYLTGVVSLALENEKRSKVNLSVPFRSRSELLLVNTIVTTEPEELKLTDLGNITPTDDYKIKLVHHCLVIANKTCDLYTSLPSFTEVFSVMLCYLKKMPGKYYPKSTQHLLQGLLTKLSSRRSRSFLVFREKPVKIIQQIEPQFDEVFDNRKKRTGSKQENEKAKLMHKLKKDTKSAIREIRKDNQFLAKQKLNERIDRDRERKIKVKRIYSELATQEGDYQSIKRQKAPKL